VVEKHHGRRRVDPIDQQLLPHINEARPEFLDLLRSLKGDAAVDGAAQISLGTEFMDSVRPHARTLGFTDGDLNLLSDALKASERLKDSSIGLEGGEFQARFMAYVERRLGMSLSTLSPGAMQAPDVYLQDFMPADACLKHMKRLFYNVLGGSLYDHFSTTVNKDPRTGFALACDFHRHLNSLHEVPKEVIVHEYGVGDGNLAAAFLHKMMELDREHDTDYQKRIRYVLCDFSDEVLNSVAKNMFLLQFTGNIRLARVDAETLKTDDPSIERYFRDGCVHKVISNELADELGTTVIVKSPGRMGVGYMRPLIRGRDVTRLGIDADGFKRAYESGDVETLKSYPPFFDAIALELVVRPATPEEIPDWDVVKDLLQSIGGENVNVAVNHGFHNHLKAIRRVLNAESGQGYDIFDNGAIDLSKIKVKKPQIIKTQGDYCSIVNFPVVASACANMGLNVTQLEYQRRYVSRELEPVIYLEDLILTHPSMRKGWNEKQFDTLSAGVRPVINPNYDNILTRWKLIQSITERFSAPIMNPGILEATMRVYEKERIKGEVGIRYQLNMLTRSEVDASMPGLEMMGFSRHDLRAVFDGENYGERTQYVHMRVTPKK